MLRRKAKSDETATQTSVQVVDKPGGKGRPTPKRRDAEIQRKARVKPPRDRKEAYRLARENARLERAKQRQGLLKGDERALPVRDRGPVKAHVRDVIDRRRSAAEFFLPFAVGVLLITFVDSAVVRGLSVYAWMIMLILIIVDSFVVRRTIRREVAEKFPQEDAKGAVSYGIMRSLQMRRLRLPPPRVKVGGAPR